MTAQTRVVVVDDSTYIRKVLQRVLDGDTQLSVVGTAESGEAFLSQIDLWRPDVVTLDMQMPGVDGLEVLRRLRAAGHTMGVVIFSGVESPPLPEHLRSGVAFVDKRALSLVDIVGLRNRLVATIQGLLPVTTEDTERSSDAPQKMARPALLAGAHNGLPEARALQHDIVLIGASTGGPQTVEHILQGLGVSFAVPLVVVQHMAKGFTQGFANRLNGQFAFDVVEASSGMALRPNCVFIAPAGLDTLLREDGGQPCFDIVAPRNPHCVPSIDAAFCSAVEIYAHRVAGVVLTGMGSDGAVGLARIRDNGGQTFVQEAGSCVVPGMPRAALELDGGHQVVLPGDLAARLV